MASKKNCPQMINVVTKIDCKSPKLSLENYYKPRNLEDNAKRVLEIDKENMELLKNLYYISQTKGRISEEINNNNENEEKESGNTQKNDSDRIVKENIELYRSIRRAISTFSTAPKKIKSKRSTKSHSRCFFEIEIPRTKQKLGEIEIQLYIDDVPKICDKFKKLCSDSEGSKLKGTSFHQIIRGYLCQFGMGIDDFFIDDLEKENPNAKHNKPGIISLGKSGNNFVFHMTFKKLEVLDEKNIVFGKVVRGIANMYKIEAVGTKTGKPREKITILNCGLR